MMHISEFMIRSQEINIVYTCINKLVVFSLVNMVFSLHILPSCLEVSLPRAFTDPAIVYSMIIFSFLLLIMCGLLSRSEYMQIYYCLFLFYIVDEDSIKWDRGSPRS
jgi:hypothetical protein